MEESGVWYGEYSHTLDDKDRFVLPSRFREKIKTAKKKKLFITRGLDGCLFIFDQDSWQAIEEKLKNLPFTKKQSRFFNRLYFSGAHEIEIDSQGRLSVPGNLKEFAKIAREIIILGVGDRIEVWDKQAWQEFYRENQPRFEETAENIFDIQ